MTASVYSWLVAQALWSDVVFTVVGVVVTGVLGWLWLRIKGIHPFRLWERHVRAQEDQARHLARVACQLEQPNKETP